MQVRKAIITTAVLILLLTLAACGNSGADIPISKLEFGMSEEQIKAVVKAAPDEEYSSMLASYKGSIDLAEDSWICSFSCGENGLDEIHLYKEQMASEECFCLRDELIQKLCGLYDVSQDDWEIENDGYSNYCEYRRESGRRIQLYIRLYDDDEDKMSMLFIIRADYVKNDEKISVIPKK